MEGDLNPFIVTSTRHRVFVGGRVGKIRGCRLDRASGQNGDPAGQRKRTRLLTSTPTARSPKGRPAVVRRVSTNHGSCSRIENSIAGSSTRGPRPNSSSLEKFKGPSRGSGEVGITTSSNGQRSSDATPQGWRNGVAGAAENGRVKRPKEAAHSIRAKAPGTEGADAFDEATDARGPRCRRPATDGDVTMVPEASPPNADAAEKAAARTAAPPKGRRGEFIHKEPRIISPDSGRKPGNRSGRRSARLPFCSKGQGRSR